MTRPITTTGSCSAFMSMLSVRSAHDLNARIFGYTRCKLNETPRRRTAGAANASATIRLLDPSSEGSRPGRADSLSTVLRQCLDQFDRQGTSPGSAANTGGSRSQAASRPEASSLTLDPEGNLEWRPAKARTTLQNLPHHPTFAGSNRYGQTEPVASRDVKHHDRLGAGWRNRRHHQQEEDSCMPIRERGSVPRSSRSVAYS